MTSGPPGASHAPIIVTDSTCDLPPALFAQYDIQVLPLNILFGSESYRSGIDMDLEQFAERLAASWKPVIIRVKPKQMITFDYSKGVGI